MILLKADQGLTDPQIMSAINVSRPCVERIRKRFVEGSLERALNENQYPGQVECYDYEYKRNGVRNLNVPFEPLIGQR